MDILGVVIVWLVVACFLSLGYQLFFAREKSYVVVVIALLLLISVAIQQLCLSYDVMMTNMIEEKARILQAIPQ
jgi:hypothetical protein